MALEAKKRRFRFNFRGSLSIPYLIFMVIMVIIPLFLIIYYAFSDDSGKFNFFSNWTTVLGNSTNWKVILITLLISSSTTILCLLIAYPIAMILSNSKLNKNKVLVYLFLLPMWINFVIRTVAMKFMINTATSNMFGFKLTVDYPYIAIIVGMVYDYLPFAILPLYNQMLKLDHNQIEAAADLGANPFQVFFKNIIPMTIPGIISAATMTFMPTMSSYVIANYMSERSVPIIGTLIDDYFSKMHFNYGSVLSLLMLILISLTMVGEMFLDKKGDSKKGGIL